MVKCVAPNQAAIKPFLCFWTGSADLSMERAQIVSIRSRVVHCSYCQVGECGICVLQTLGGKVALARMKRNVSASVGQTPGSLAWQKHDRVVSQTTCCLFTTISAAFVRLLVKRCPFWHSSFAQTCTPLYLGNARILSCKVYSTITNFSPTLV